MGDKNMRIRAAMWEDNMRGRGVVAQHPSRDPALTQVSLKRENVRLFDPRHDITTGDTIVIGSSEDGWSFARVTGFRASDTNSKAEIETVDILASMTSR